MRKVTVFSGQSIYDMSLQEYGSIEALFDILESNDLGIDDELDELDEVMIDDNFIADERTRDFYLSYSEGGEKLNTGDFNKELGPQGIEFWGIEIDFIVSDG